jgi:uncharacterized membrane protein
MVWAVIGGVVVMLGILVVMGILTIVFPPDPEEYDDF